MLLTCFGPLIAVLELLLVAVWRTLSSCVQRHQLMFDVEYDMKNVLD